MVPKSEQSHAHGHAVVLVGLEDSRHRSSWDDRESIFMLVRLDARSPQLRDDGVDSVGLFATDEADASDPGGVVSEDRHGGERLRGVGDVTHLNVDATQLRGSGNRGLADPALYGRSHRLEHVHEPEVTL
jgi:hypothetical protein